MKVLIIAPHPDDEVLGCGGTIVRHVQDGDEVYLTIVTKAYTPEWSEEFIKNRPKEVARANGILGIKKTFFLDFPTVRLDTVPQQKLNEALAEVVKKVEPDVIYAPFKGDLNKDHRLIFEAVLVVARPYNSSTKKLICYEVLSETEWGQSLEVFVPNMYVDINKTFDKKIQAMRVYKSELKPSSHPRSLENIEMLAKKRGSECGLQLAEAFQVIREIIK